MDRAKAKAIAQITAQMNAGNWAAAEASLLSVLKRYPADYGFLEFMGVVKMRRKQPEASAKFFKKALKASPRNPVAFRNLARAEQLLGRITSAQANLYKALKLDPRYAEGWYSLGKIQATKDQDDKAINSYSKALRLRPDAAAVAADLLLLLERRNRLDELEQHIDLFLKQAPDHPITQLFLGVLNCRNKDYEAAKSILESIDFSDDSVADFKTFELKRLRYLAKALDSLNLAEPAYKTFAEAKALNRALHKIKLDPELYRTALAARDAYFSSGTKPAWENLSTAKESPIFMVGFPRSGTTLLDTFLRGHKAISVLEEKPTVTKMRESLGTVLGFEPALLDQITPEGLNAARKAYLEALRSYKQQGLVIDKMPLNLSFAGEIMRVFPKARFIFVVRDPADAVFSCFMQNFKLNASMVTLENPLEAAKTYDSTMRIWHNAVDILNIPFVESRYENLVHDPEATLRPIVEFLGVDWDKGLLDHQRTAKSRGVIGTPSYAQVVEPIYNTAVARWERYADLMPEALEILAPWRKKFGYSD